ncbi:hypothetical protein [Allomesorhizobium camelthorni]|uniref:GIY-YIG domain-containing protein n=1 Tax=Allomesorhizobium camelthorni TaxID=475069 RepID=A0A6G4WL39_9HYPH|nr:hypothetical protein [Mesorhizobium camelthorni]NGO55481.1 hypothetical protein [Mesorhizobium camelthorni]
MGRLQGAAFSDLLDQPRLRRGASAPSNECASELELEWVVSDYMRSLSVVALNVPDEPGPDSLRGFIERNAIALLTNYSGDPGDPPSDKVQL